MVSASIACCVDLFLHRVELVIEPGARAPVLDRPVRALLLEHGNGRFMLHLQFIAPNDELGEIVDHHAALSTTWCAPGGP
jgi:hypothetical protein